MNKKSSQNVAAVIEIASSAIRMNVSQIKKGAISILEELEYPINLGHDVFNGRRISFENLRMLSEILEKYTVVMDTYGAGKRMAVSGSVLREAENRAFVTDQIKIQNKLSVEVMEENTEKSLLYFDILDRGTVGEKSGNCLIAYIGSGSIGLAVYDGKNIVHTQNIPMGSLKMYDILSELRRDSEDFYTVIEEYLDTMIRPLGLSDFQIDELFLTGPEVSLITKLTGAEELDGKCTLSTSALLHLYEKIRGMTAENIASDYGITEREAVVLFHSIFIYVKILSFCSKKKRISSSEVDITKVFLRQMLVPRCVQHYHDFLRESTVTCTEVMAKAGKDSGGHTSFVGDHACLIFDRLKKIHGLDAASKTILRAASILYNCRPFSAMRHSFESVYNMIGGADIFGLTRDETAVCGLVAASALYPKDLDESPHFYGLPSDRQIYVSKLTAIFKLAAALDHSEKQKLKSVKITLSENKLTIRANTALDPALERWAFDQASDFFQSVFGIYSELIVKSQFLS